MKVNSLLILLVMAGLLTGCGRKVEYEGEAWYENYDREEEELEISGETASDSLADDWEYGLVPHADSDLAEDDTYYYIANPVDLGKLYRVKKDGSWGKEKLLDAEADEINVLHGKVYFAHYNDDDVLKAGIYCMDTEGGEPEMLTDMYPSEMYVVNDWIYFNDYNDTGIYKIHCETKELQHLMDKKCGFLNVCENMIYVLLETEKKDENNNNCWQPVAMDVNGDNMRIFGSFENCNSMILADGMLYFGDSEGWWETSVDEIDERELICADFPEVSPRNVIGDEIYYRTDQNKLAKYNMNSGENKIYNSVSNLTGYHIFDGMIEIFYTEGTESKVSVNGLESGAPVAFYE